ncbi:30S ribosomal protein S1 [Marinicrinis sediminis]|uniref:30S ribosomal protein S1 n=1 Tax=Marinicrinis sediminis TaxID=1652465 RepID=A0ABW5RDK9_9BACL
MTEEINVNENQQTEAEQSQMEDVTTIKNGDVVTGKIVKVEDNQVLVDFGYKYDGIIPIRELSAVHLEKASDVAEEGQDIQVKVISIDDENEKCILSKRAVESEKAWDTLAERLESGEVFEATVADVVKGGLVVDVGARGFIPASMVERHFVEDFSDYKGRTVRLKVKELDKEANKVILSQKDVLDEEFEAKKKEIIAGLEAGQELEGTVQRLTQFGAFVDVGGVDGLVHISEMSWTHVDKPSDVVKEGDQVQVKILKVDPENERISLSMKAAQPGPWEQADGKFNPGDTVQGTVKRIVDFGAFVEIAAGVEGLVHISQIAHRHVTTPHEALKVGQEVNVKILDINLEEKRISLSIKATEEAPAREEQATSNASDKEVQEKVSSSQGLSLTLGERFGDKLSKFK